MFFDFRDEAMKIPKIFPVIWWTTGQPGHARPFWAIPWGTQFYHWSVIPRKIAMFWVYPHFFRRITTYFACYSARFTQPPTNPPILGSNQLHFVFIVIIFVVIVVAIIFFTTALDRHQMRTNRKRGMDLQMADWSIFFAKTVSVWGITMLRCPKWFCNLCI